MSDAMSHGQPDTPQGGNVSRETSDRLGAFEALLRRWNARINLVSPGDLADLRTRHIEDSLQLVPLLPAGDAPLVDLGSGAGFPGLILGLATGRPVTLVEADHRKASFLREAARVTGTRAEVLPERIERCAIRDAPVITARALASLDTLLGLAAPLLAPEGTCLFLKGAKVGEELTAAQRRWQMVATRHPSRTTPDGCILEVTHLRAIDDEHAR